MTRYFFFGSVRSDPDGHTRITVGDEMRIQGGSQQEHEETVEIVSKFKERVKAEGSPEMPHAAEILRDVIREVKKK